MKFSLFNICKIKNRSYQILLFYLKKPKPLLAHKIKFDSFYENDFFTQ